MLIPLLTFLAVAAIVVGSYWAFVLRPERSEETTLRRRLRVGVARTPVVTSVSAERKLLSQIPALDAALSHSRALVRGLQDTIDRSGLHVTVGAVFLASACLAAVVFELAAFLGMMFLVALLLAVMAAILPSLYLRYKAAKRTERFEELFPEALSLIVRALRAGHAFTTGLAMVADEMDDPVGPEFRKLYEQQNFGMPLEDALREFAERVRLLDVRFFVTAVLTQRQAGGNLAEVLENLISVIGDRFKVKRQIRVVTAHARITGTVLMVLPVVTAFVMMALIPQHMRLLWTDATGIRLLTAGIVLQIVGAIAIRRIIRIDY